MARRTKAEIEAIKSTIYAVVEEDPPMSVRQVFYQLTTLGVIEKTEKEYKNTVVRLLGDMRRKREMPYEWIADNTRLMRKPNTHASLGHALQATSDYYRRALWLDQDAYVEVWLEKEALSGVVYPVTKRYDVPLMVTRGYPSISFLHQAAIQIERMNKAGKTVFLYQFGDHDPSGADIPRATEAGINDAVSDLVFTFHRAAVLPYQIKEMNLPTRPTKKTDSRSKNFTGESVELDAIPAGTLRQMVSDHITQHIDAGILEQTEKIEEEERRSLEMLSQHFPIVAEALDL